MGDIEQYDREAGTNEWIEKFKQEKADLESQKDTMHPAKYKLGINSLNAIISDLEQQLARKIKIIINGIDHLWFDETIYYEEVFFKAYGKYPGRINITCTYSNPGHNSGGGFLTINSKPIIPREGMSFTIIDTSNA